MSDDDVLRVVAAAYPGSVAWRRAVATVGGFTPLTSRSPHELRALGLDASAYTRLHQPSEDRLRAWREWLESSPQRRLVHIGCPDYPPQLTELADAPLALWAHGPRVDLLRGPLVAIVGSRSATAGGCATARELSRALGEAGISVISGLAVGIDAAAHHGAVATAGSTIAVLGSAIDIIYPRRNRRLAEAILESGLIVSEYPPGIGTRAHHFPERNRIIAGLSLGTVVVEAAARSGALITARLAGEYGREVFAVPGSIHSALSRGPHRLIGDGARLVEGAYDVITEIAPALAAGLERPPTAEPPPATPRSAAYRALLRALGFAPAHIAELARASGLTTTEVSSMLLHLELEGTVEALPGGRYCRLI